MIYEDAIVASDDVSKDFQPKSNDDGLGDFYLTLVVDFKATTFILLDSRGAIIYTQDLENVFPIELDIEFSKLTSRSGTYFVAVRGNKKEHITAEKITYIKDIEETMLYAKITTYSESVDKVIDDLPKLKETTRRKIQEFSKTYYSYSYDYGSYLRLNLATFFTSTTSSPGLNVSSDFVNKLVAGATSDRTSFLLEKVGGKAFIEKKIGGGITAVATAIGGATGNAPGAVAGFLVGTAIDVFVNYILGNFLPSDAEQAIAENQGMINTYLEKLENDVKNKIVASQDKMNNIVEVDADLLYLTEDKDEVLFIYEIYDKGVDFLKKQKISESKNLANSLLKIWLKENAGDDADDGNRYTNDAQWDKNLQTLREDYSVMGGDGGLANEPDVFIYQFESELQRWGILDNCRAIVATMRKCIEAENDVEGIYKEYHQKKIWFHTGKEIKDFDTFFKFLQQTDDHIGYGTPIYNHIKKSFDSGTMEFAISLNLSIDEQSLFVTNFEYLLKDDTQNIGISNTRSWNENIDDGIKK